MKTKSDKLATQEQSATIPFLLFFTIAIGVAYVMTHISALVRWFGWIRWLWLFPAVLIAAVIHTLRNDPMEADD